jgi:DNA-binding XRE family transcriptional regulator
MKKKFNVEFLAEAQKFLECYAYQKKNKMTTVSLDAMIDKHVGKIGTPARDAFEYELSIDLIGEAIKRARKERNLTQEELGKLVGVQKAQISKIENSIKNARLDTIIKIFKALGATIKFNVELDYQQFAH